ncbi:MAG TPA: DUF2341 domain-containing protein [bacterium]|nr:DUF2341 domain-containing protein [bacterium]
MGWLEDRFDEASLKDLDAHIADTGQTYSSFPNFTDTPPEDSVGSQIPGSSGYVRSLATGAIKDFTYNVDAALGETNFDLIADIYMSDNSQPSARVGVLWYADIAVGTGYSCWYNAQTVGDGFIQIIRQQSSGNSIASAQVPYTFGTVKTLKVEVRGDTFDVYWGGSFLFSVTDTAWSGDYVGLHTWGIGSMETRIYDFIVSAPGLDPCTSKDPSVEAVYDEFDGFADTPLEDHVTPSGHAWNRIIGEAPNELLILDGLGQLVSTFGFQTFMDIEQLIFAPRTKNYEIGICFNRADLPNMGSYLKVLARMTNDTYYEVRLGDMGIVELRKSLGGGFINNHTILDLKTGQWLTDRNVYLQLIVEDNNIKVRINGLTVIDENDVDITNTGSIAIGISGFAEEEDIEEYWTLNWFYVDDTYETFGNPDNVVNIIDGFQSPTTFIRSEEDPDTEFQIINDPTSLNDQIASITKGELAKTINLVDPFLANELMTTNQEGCTWYLPEWLYRKKVTIDNTKVSGGGDHTNFPVLVSITDTGLRDNAQADGDDILFTSDDELTKLKHELVSYNSGTGALVAWVKVPTLKVASDTDIFVYYGNSDAAAQEDPTNVWTNYHAVFHLEEDPSGGAPQVTDSGPGGNHGTTEGTMLTEDLVNAKVGKGYDVDGSDDAWECPGHNPASGNWTFSFWVKKIFLASGANPVYTLMHQNNGTGLGRDHLSFIRIGADGSYVYRLQSFIGGGPTLGADDWDATDDNIWFFLSVTYDGTTLRIYANGILYASALQTAEAADGNKVFARTKVNNLFFDGVMDEIRIQAGTALSADWLLTEHKNQDSPGTFLSIGSQEDSCISKLVELLETTFLISTLSYPSKDLTIFESAFVNDLIDNGGTNKIFQISEFLNSNEIIIPGLEINVSDALNTSEVISRAFTIAESLSGGENLDISAILNVVDTGNMTDLIALQVLIAITEGMSLSEILEALRILPETFTMNDVIEILNTARPNDIASFGESVSIVKSGTTENTDPDNIYSIKRSTYLVL